MNKEAYFEVSPGLNYRIETPSELFKDNPDEAVKYVCDRYDLWSQKESCDEMTFNQIVDLCRGTLRCFPPNLGELFNSGDGHRIRGYEEEYVFLADLLDQSIISISHEHIPFAKLPTSESQQAWYSRATCRDNGGESHCRLKWSAWSYIFNMYYAPIVASGCSDKNTLEGNIPIAECRVGNTRVDVMHIPSGTIIECGETNPRHIIGLVNSGYKVAIYPFYTDYLYWFSSNRNEELHDILIQKVVTNPAASIFKRKKAAEDELESQENTRS